jgi:biopolymer transport protein ExbD
MAIRLQSTDNTQLNMTPMIDIVFQLILFFLFSIHFKSLDWRIESAMPKDRGPRITNTMVEQNPHIRVTLSRRNAEDLEAARTHVRVGSMEWTLPPVTAPAEERDAVFARIGARLGTLHRETGWPGEIDAPLPTGGLVPHADVVGVLDAFLGQGVLQVDFSGTAEPRPRAGR